MSQVQQLANALAGLDLSKPPDTSEKPYLAGKDWYYGSITRSQCDALLAVHGQNGDFLIRDSETNVSIVA
jgi:NCK adaptor protein